MSPIATLLLALSIVLAQVSVARSCAILDGVPHLVLLTVLYFAIWAPRAQSMLLAVSSGLLLDFVSLDQVFVNVVSFVALTYALSELARAALLKRAPMRALAVSCSLPAFFVVRWFSVRLLEGVELDIDSMLRSSAVTLLYAWPVFSVYRGFHARLVAREVRPAYQL